MAITASIPAYKQGKPVMYEIVVSLGHNAKEYRIYRRYNDFLKLAKDVESEMGEPVTVAPPQKPGLWGTVDCEQRRIDLEIMLTALLRVPEFADSLAVSNFLEVYTRKSEHRPTTQTVDWVHTTTEVSKLIGEARGSHITPHKRQVLIQAKALVGQLQRELSHANKLGQGELSRRQQQLDNYLVALRQVETDPKLISSSDAGSNFNSLYNNTNTTNTTRVLGETDETRKLNNAGLLQAQQNAIEDQDDLIESLRAAVSRQKELGLAVHSEILKQNELLDELDSDVHRVNARLNEARRKTERLNR